MLYMLKIVPFFLLRTGLFHGGTRLCRGGTGLFGGGTCLCRGETGLFDGGRAAFGYAGGPVHGGAFRSKCPLYKPFPFLAPWEPVHLLVSPWSLPFGAVFLLPTSV